MIIGIMSDSHGSLKWFKIAYEILKKSSLIIHAGDVLYHGPRNPFPDEYSPAVLSNFINTIPEEKIIFVKGNCNSDVDQMVIKHNISKRFRILDLKPLMLGIIHGDQFKTDNEMFDFMDKFDIDILIHGHYHVKKSIEKEGKIIISPGSISLPKDSTKSVAFLKIDGINVEVEFIDISENKSIAKKTYNIIR